MRTVVLPLLWLSACLPPGSAQDDGAFAPDLDPPKIVELAVACDLEAGRWRLEIKTDAWAGGAAVLWTVDGVYAEQHTAFRSIAAAEDGTADRLRNDIAILADFRPAQDGVTAFTCNQAPNALLWVFDLDGERSDCVYAAVAPELVLSLPSAPPCANAWVPPEVEP